MTPGLGIGTGILLRMYDCLLQQNLLTFRNEIVCDFAEQVRRDWSGR